MICRHGPGDPSCSSNQPNVIYQDKIVYRDKPVPITPDADNYTIEDVHREGKHLVIKAKYPAPNVATKV